MHSQIKELGSNNKKQEAKIALLLEENAKLKTDRENDKNQIAKLQSDRENNKLRISNLESKLDRIIAQKHSEVITTAKKIWEKGRWNYPG